MPQIGPSEKTKHTLVLSVFVLLLVEMIFFPDKGVALTILIRKAILYSIQYKNLLKCKLGCF